MVSVIGINIEDSNGGGRPATYGCMLLGGDIAGDLKGLPPSTGTCDASSWALGCVAM